jgi:hypothetical protein
VRLSGGRPRLLVESQRRSIATRDCCRRHDPILRWRGCAQAEVLPSRLLSRQDLKLLLYCVTFLFWRPNTVDANSSTIW